VSAWQNLDCHFKVNQREPRERKNTTVTNRIVVYEFLLVLWWSMTSYRQKTWFYLYHRGSSQNLTVTLRIFGRC